MTTDIVFDVTGLEPGVHKTELSVVSNDPSQAELSIPIVLNLVDNEEPRIVNPLGDVTLYVTEPPLIIDVQGGFHDSENDSLVFSVASENSSVASVWYNNGSLMVSPLKVGETMVTVSAFDGINVGVTDSFVVSVLENREPIVLTPIGDQVLTVGSIATTIDLANVFQDPEDDGLTFVVESSNYLVSSASVFRSMLQLNSVSEGICLIAVVATDSKGASTEISFTVTVTRQSPPRVVNPIGNQVRYLTQDDITFSLMQVFLDDNADSLVYTANSDENSIVFAVVRESELELVGRSVGTAQIEVTACDGFSNPVVHRFSVMMRENTIPIVINELEDIEMNVDDDASVIDLAPIFSDGDGDPLSYSVEVINDCCLKAIIQGGELRLDAYSKGVAVVRVYATDGKGENVYSEFEVNIDDGGVYDGIEDEAEFVESNSVYNIPNPFSSTTRISYTLKEAGDIKVSILSMQGVLMEILVDGFQLAGKQIVDFDGSTIQPGIYFLTIQQKSSGTVLRKIVKK